MKSTKAQTEPDFSKLFASNKSSAKQAHALGIPVVVIPTNNPETNEISWNHLSRDELRDAYFLAQKTYSSDLIYVLKEEAAERYLNAYEPKKTIRNTKSSKPA